MAQPDPLIEAYIAMLNKEPSLAASFLGPGASDYPPEVRRHAQKLLSSANAAARAEVAQIQKQARDGNITVSKANAEIVHAAGRLLPSGTHMGFSLRGLDFAVRDLREMLSDAAAFEETYLQYAKFAEKIMRAKALELVNDRRRRKGWAARFAYQDRGGRHILEDAIMAEGSIVMGTTGTTSGNGTAYVGWDEKFLMEHTLAPDSNVGFYRAYEHGNTFMMPAGVWVGPGGNLVSTISSRYQKDKEKTKHERTDQFHVTGGLSAVVAHTEGQHVFADSFRYTRDKLAKAITKQTTASHEPVVNDSEVPSAAAQATDAGLH